MHRGFPAVPVAHLLQVILLIQELRCLLLDLETLEHLMVLDFQLHRCLRAVLLHLVGQPVLAVHWILLYQDHRQIRELPAYQVGRLVRELLVLQDFQEIRYLLELRVDQPCHSDLEFILDEFCIYYD